ncbi:acyl-CoA dehydrogenase [Mycolicibacterium sp. P9-22]|nr:acyl-CoA dehydrogenase [Mycolicibacterium sp. P9-22]
MNKSDDWRGRLQTLLEARVKAGADGAKPDRIEAARCWHANLVDNSLAAPGWPKTAGGLELSVADQIEYYQLIAAAGAPPHPCPLSFIVAPTLIKHGTDEQRARFLRPLLRADEFWCQGFSEPGAGSDLASLSTRAVRDGEVYRINGQKVWTTMAERADWMFALVRTGPAGRSTEGITYLLIPMDSKGVTVRPLRDISGGAHFAEVFFDDVEVSVRNRVGDEGQGWSIMRTSLGHERATAFLADEFKYRRTLDQVLTLVAGRGLESDPLVLQHIAELESDVRTIAANSARALTAVRGGEDPGGVASVNRLVKSEFEQRLHALALRAAGPYGALGSRAAAAVDGGRWTYGYLMSRATTIGAGTAEIQRNTIAEAVLGLPSHRGEGTRPPSVSAGTPLLITDPNEAALRAALSEALASVVDLEALLAGRAPSGGVDRAAWSALTTFGLPALSIDESVGGARASARMLYAAIEETAKALASTPLVPTVVTLEVALAAGATTIASRIASGTTAAFAVPLDDNGWITAGGDLPSWDGERLNGAVPVVSGAPVADIMLALARSDTNGGTVLIAIDPGGPDVSVVAHQPFDLTSTVGAVTFAGVRGELVSAGDELATALRSARRRSTLAVAADSVGVAARALNMAVTWAAEREQFGRPIGSFQAISHRCADILVALESARGQVFAAAEAEDSASGQDGQAELAAASAMECAIAAAESAIQIHGGIGFTWEHPAHLLLRRAKANAAGMGRPEMLRDFAARALMARFRTLHADGSAKS